MKKRWVSLVLSAAMAVSLLAGCGESGGAQAEVKENAAGNEEGAGTSAEKKGKITYVAQAGGAEWDKYTMELIPQFEEETGIEVDVEFYSQSELFQLIEVKMSNKSDEFDVIAVDAPMVAGYADRGYLLSMDDYFSEEEKAKFTESALEAGSWQGNFYAPAKDSSAQALFYNKELLAEAGITMPEADPNNRITWEELYDMAKQVQETVDPDGTKGISGLMFEQVSTVYQMLALPNSLGEKSIGDDGYTVDGIINSDGWVKSMTYYHDLFEQGIAPRGMSSAETLDSFVAGKIAFFVGGTWVTSCMSDDFEWGFTYHPCWEGYEDKVATPTGSWHVAVSSYSKNQEAAAEFVKWFTIGEGNSKWFDLVEDVPATIDLVEKFATDEKYKEFPSNIQQFAAYESEHTAFPRPVTPGYATYESVLNAAMEDIRNGADPKTALDMAVDQLNSAFLSQKGE